ncbi:MAG: hypothetical protein Q9213_001713 [Squamulea squamosa]
MATTEGNGIRAIDPQHPADGTSADAIAQRAAIANHRKNRKRKERQKTNMKHKRDHVKATMVQARRWLGNEQRKEDRGGISKQGFQDLFAWARQSELSWDGPVAGRGEMTADAVEARARFRAEWENARKQQDRKNGVRDWWTYAPSLKERTGVSSKELMELSKGKIVAKAREEEMVASGDQMEEDIAYDAGDVMMGEALVGGGMSIEHDGEGNLMMQGSGMTSVEE